ncbi:BatA domain-containing protein [Tenacibaculum aiptasiae]|uniref:BatA domain-containing protein n=1 Tax=Tenacibaculum aiptasiae TaxID=426481 RepID=UPI00232CC162|nr:BatA domain-containing protein [Tenacibaculum aiptasiae]
MHFKHPEILYFLGLLIIPVLVHLFQLQRFVKVPFTNVAFLQKLVLQTRKSSQIKKWLILSTRLLLLTAIIFAFAQPYFSNHTIDKKKNFFIYLDNSLSTNTKGEKGNLLQIASQEIIENLSDNVTYSLLTNDNFYRNKTTSDLKKILLKVSNTSKNRSLKDVLLKVSTENKAQNSLSKNIFISDFQNYTKNDFDDVNTPISLVNLIPELKNNIAIDSVFLDDNGSSNFNLNILVSNQGKAQKNIPISLSDDNKLINKQTFSIEENQVKKIVFSIVKSPEFLGKISLNFSDTYSFDNSFYFTIDTSTKINVLAIGKPSDFINRIYTKDEFNLTVLSSKNINYNLIPKQSLIILNELEKIPQPLINSLVDYTKKGGNIIIIPNKNTSISSYNELLTSVNAGKIVTKKNDSLKITSINYNHPLLKNVFEKRVQNFQYPFVKESFTSILNNESNLVSFENKDGFIKQVNLSNASLYWVAAPLEKENSNFTNSPLIVPVFYNIGKHSLQLSELYYTIGEDNTIDINKQLGKDEILTISNNENSFIPLQQTFQNKVRITTKDQPLKAGFYQIKQQESFLKNIAYNYPKSESSLQFLDISSTTNKDISTSVKNTLQDINSETKIQWLWKWFLALAIVSLLLEILILKFFKT